jgi:hypothetical protein
MATAYKGFSIEIASRKDRGAWSADARILSERTEIGLYAGGAYFDKLKVEAAVMKLAERRIDEMLSGTAN